MLGDAVFVFYIKLAPDKWQKIARAFVRNMISALVYKFRGHVLDLIRDLTYVAV